MKTIMVIEDDKSLARVAELNLVAEGYQVMVCRDGRAALATLSRFAPDLILLDLKLPLGSGWDLLAYLRQQEHLQQVPVVVLSAFARAQDKEQARAAGATEYLVKPFGIVELLNCVKRLLSDAEKT